MLCSRHVYIFVRMCVWRTIIRIVDKGMERNTHLSSADTRPEN